MTLIIDNLDVSRGNQIILSGVCAQVQAGQALILRGPNGIGKTSMLRMLAGFLPVGGGDVTFGAARLRDRDGLQEHVAYGGHSDGIKAQLTVRQNLEFWQRLYGAGDITPGVNAFDLNGFLDRDVSTCSAGQKRRLGLARMVISGRTIWLLDEPSVSLDTASKEALARAMSQHLKRGGIAIMATHEADLIASAQTLDLTPFKAGISHDVFLDEAFT